MNAVLLSSVELCLLPKHDNLGMGDKRREWTLHTQAHPCRCRPPGQPLPGSLSSHHALSSADVWMEEAPQMGFAKSVWKALGLPPMMAQDTKGGLLCPEQPDLSMLLQPVSLNPAALKLGSG